MTNQLYNANEVGDHGSVAQLLELLKTPELDPKNVAANFNGWSDAWHTITDAYFLTAAMTCFGMNSLADNPTQNIPSGLSDDN